MDTTQFLSDPINTDIFELSAQDSAKLEACNSPIEVTDPKSSSNFFISFISFQAASVTIKYDVKFVLGEGNSFTDADTAYTQTKNNIDLAISNTHFTQSLQDYSAQYGSTSYNGVSANQPGDYSDYETTVIGGDESDDEELSGNEIAGIVIGSIGGAVALGSGYYYYSLFKDVPASSGEDHNLGSSHSSNSGSKSYLSHSPVKSQTSIDQETVNPLKAYGKATNHDYL